MQITIASYSLCDGADRTVNKSAGPANLTITGKIEAQLVPYLRSTDITVCNRGNRSTEISFHVAHLCASPEAAEDWAILHPVTATRSGTVTFTGNGYSLRLLTAVLTTITCATIGATVMVTYTIIGGKLETAT
jgi:hypothetical protein